MAGEKSIEQIVTANPFINGPGDYLCQKIIEELRKEPKWVQMFGDNMDAYERFDYSMRALPALRVFNQIYRKETESHYIVGDVHIDVILPPFLRRNELQVVQDLFSSALVQQFRRIQFFHALRLAVPSLNELGKSYDVDKTLGMQFDEEILPITRMTANFRLDLKAWDDYLTSDNRTKEDPFTRTLGVLKRIVTVIQANNDVPEVVEEVGLDQTIEGD